MEQRIRKLEQDIQKLKTAYDQYFAGVERRPPDKLADKVAREVRALTSTVITNTALRFRNQQAISRYNTFLQYWQRNLKEMEEGRKPRRRLVAAPSALPSSPGADPGNGVFEVSTRAAEKVQMDQLFSAIDREYQKAGNGKKPDRSKMQAALEKQTQMIREKYGCESVAFRVVNEGGKVTIKAGPGGRKKP